MIYYVIRLNHYFLDYYACSSVIPKQYTEILKSITKACKKIQCALIGGETAEMPSLTKKIILIWLVSCWIKTQSKRLRVKKNDLIIGVRSNGFHSNGYSLIRKIIKENKINLKGKNWEKKLSHILMQPTRLYHQLVNESDLNKIKALSHITGDYSNFKFLKPSKKCKV